MLTPQEKFRLMSETVEKAFRVVRPEPSNDPYEEADLWLLREELHLAVMPSIDEGLISSDYRFDTRVCDGCGLPMVKFTARFIGSVGNSQLLVHEKGESSSEAVGVAYAPYFPGGLPVAFGPEVREHLQKWVAKAGEN